MLFERTLKAFPVCGDDELSFDIRINTLKLLQDLTSVNYKTRFLENCHVRLRLTHLLFGLTNYEKKILV